jgi:dethiobiotin synthetase/adenosylmethionine--8-amino-7-oxononanoate aminotransferase
MTNGEWQIELPAKLRADGRPTAGTEFVGLDVLFHLKARQDTDLYRDYTRYITRTLEGLRDKGYKFGALMLEPVVLGAGGMMLADPLFQQALVNVVRSDPKLFSESAPAWILRIKQVGKDSLWSSMRSSGLYRLGSPSSARFLNVHPDITVHAKLLTGGLLPLAATVASESIFGSFESDDKSDALLHGHSYTAHAVGCQVAIESLETHPWR